MVLSIWPHTSNCATSATQELGYQVKAYFPSPLFGDKNVDTESIMIDIIPPEHLFFFFFFSSGVGVVFTENTLNCQKKSGSIIAQI